ncbi:MAG: hypothetical protein AAFO69_08550 [Bacteroidota bacterium]
MKILLLIVLLISCCLPSNAQKAKKREYLPKTVHVGLVPGFSSNGIDSKNYFNRFSFNIFTEYSAGNRYLGLAGLSSFYLHTSSGFMISGLFNFVGGGRRELRKYKRSEVLELKANFTGFQIAGLQNMLTGEVTGLQLATISNLALDGVNGLQMAALLNGSGSYLFGVQLSGLMNYTGSFSSGIQLAPVLNYAKTEMYGLQLGLVNHARRTYGPQSPEGSNQHGLQIGVINHQKENGGFQFGLINISKRLNGWQIGLINYRRKTIDKDKHGYIVGLINLGDALGSVRLTQNLDGVLQAEILTGTKHIMNNLIIGRSLPGDSENPNRSKWMIGYGIGHLFHISKHQKFHPELIVRSHAFTFTKPRLEPTYAVRALYMFKWKKLPFLAIGAAINYDPHRIISNKQTFFPELTFGWWL